MQRSTLPFEKVHPAVQEKIANYKADILAQVKDAIAQHDVVVIGMAQNPFPRKARALLDARQIPHHYLAWGSYVSQWRERLAIKQWSGWPTFPQIFVKGSLIGGFSDLEKLVASGELQALLDAPRAKPDAA